MHRRLRPAIVFCVLAAAFVVFAAPAVATPAGAATSLSLVTPTGADLRATPPAIDAKVTVSWTIGAPLSSGYFCVYLINARSGTSEGAWQQNVVRGATAYSTDVILEPSYPQGDYYILVNYRTRRGATPLFSDRTDGTFRFQSADPYYHTDAAGQPVPAKILRNTDTAVTFSFWIVDPLQRTVLSADVVFFQKIGGPETRFPILNVLGLIVARECCGDPSLLNQRTVTCNLPTGYYMWAIDTRPAGGAGLIDGSYIGTLTVTRR
jgi:hypothetical protein